MLETALGADLDRFGECQTRLVKLNPKLVGLEEGSAPTDPPKASAPLPATVTAAPALPSAVSGIPAIDSADATTPGAGLAFIADISVRTTCQSTSQAAERH